jgi:hypothetical protein
MVVRESLEVLSALCELVGSELLSQLWHGLTMLSLSVPCGVDLKQKIGKYNSQCVTLLDVVSNPSVKEC